MKKLIMFLILGILVLGIFGCGDDAETFTEPTFEDFEDASYLVTIGESFTRDEMIVLVTTLKPSAVINDINLKINNVMVELEFDAIFLQAYLGAFTAAEGEQLNCEVTINGNDYTLDLIVPAYPIVDWPLDFNPSEVTDFEWELEYDSPYQYFTGYAETFDWEEFDTLEEDENSIMLSPADRFFNMPAHWLESGLESYYFDLEEISFDSDGKLVGLSTAINSSDPDYSRNNGKIDKNYLNRQVKIAKSIK